MEMTLRPATTDNRIQPRTCGPQLPRQTGAWRWPSWAARLAGRYAVTGEAWDRLAATLRVVGPAQTTVYQQVTWRNSLYQARQWPLALTLNLALHSEPAAKRVATVVVRHTPPGSSPDSVRPGGAEPQWSAPMITRLHLYETWATRLATGGAAAPLSATRQMTLRMVLAQPGAAPLDASAAPMSIDLPPVPRIVPRPPPVVASPPASANAAPAMPAALHYWGDRPPPAAPAAVNVEQLTDQVIRTLDQRVIAARERLGRS